MALAISKDAQLTLFKALFSVHDPVYLAVEDLIAKGGVVDTTLYVVKITYGGKAYTQALTTGSTSLIKGTVNDTLKAQAKFMLKTFVEQVVGVALGPDHTPQAPSAPSGWMNKAQEALNPSPTTPPTQETKAPSGDLKGSVGQKVGKPSDKVVKLRDATELGQRVYGTSAGSVYRVVALSDTVKVATSIKGHDISLRVETTVQVSPAELASVKQVVDWKSTYGSKHMHAGSVPVNRVIGAVLFSMGVSFDKMVLGAGELEAANA